MSDYLSMGQAAKVVGWTGAYSGRRLRKFLEAKEKRERRKIMARRGGKFRPRWYVTEVSLRRHCPELFDTTDEVAAQLRAHFRQQRSEIVEIRGDVAELRESMEAIVSAWKRRFGAPGRTA